jgi:hypothetical protein
MLRVWASALPGALAKSVVITAAAQMPVAIRRILLCGFMNSSESRELVLGAG